MEWWYVLWYFAVMSVCAMIAYLVDKCCAKAGAWRTPERLLLGFGLLGGAALLMD